MSEYEQNPFADVHLFEGGFSIPELKWRELLFVGALRPAGNHFVRDLARPLPAFAVPDLFPPAAKVRVRRGHGRVRIERL